jgi:hypothetical protein
MTGKPGGPMTVAKLGSNRSHDRGRRHVQQNSSSNKKTCSASLSRALHTATHRRVVRGCPWLSPREVHAEIFKPIFGQPTRTPKHAYLQVAEAEGNRTPLTEVLGHNGFEARDCPFQVRPLTCTNRYRPATLARVRMSRPVPHDPSLTAIVRR